MKQLTLYDSFDEPETPHMFHVAGICFASTRHGSLTKLHAESDVNAQGNSLEIHTLENDKGPDNRGDFHRLMIEQEDDTDIVHVHFGRSTSMENVVLVRAEKNGNLPWNKHFVEKTQGLTAIRIWDLLDAESPSTRPLDPNQTVLHGTLLRLDNQDDVWFEDRSGGMDVENARYFKLYPKKNI